MKKSIKRIILEKVGSQYSFVPEENEIYHNFSCKNLNKPQKKRMLRNTYKYCAQLACCIMLLVICSGVIVLAIGEEAPIREIFYEIGTRKRNELTVAIPDETYYKDTIEEIIFPQYIPDGYNMKLCIDMLDGYALSVDINGVDVPASKEAIIEARIENAVMIMNSKHILLFVFL